MASAFQWNGFQLDPLAFQIDLAWSPAFQKCAFQYGAFQVEECITEVVIREAVASFSGAAAAAWYTDFSVPTTRSQWFSRQHLDDIFSFTKSGRI